MMDQVAILFADLEVSRFSQFPDILLSSQHSCLEINWEIQNQFSEQQIYTLHKRHQT